MDAISKALVLSGAPGTMTIGDRTFAIDQPTPRDSAIILAEMKKQARATVVSPLVYVNAHAEQLHPGVFAEAIRSAVSLGSGGGIEPTREKIMEQYDTLEGVRWRFWYQARKLDATLTQKSVAELITEENFYEAADALYVAIGAKSLDEKKVPGNGTN